MKRQQLEMGDSDIYYSQFICTLESPYSYILGIL